MYESFSSGTTDSWAGCLLESEQQGLPQYQARRWVENWDGQNTELRSTEWPVSDALPGQIFSSSQELLHFNDLASLSHPPRLVECTPFSHPQLVRSQPAGYTVMNSALKSAYDTTGYVAAGPLFTGLAIPSSPPPRVQHNGLFFSSHDHAMTALPCPEWHCPSNDVTLPRSDSDRRRWVAQLLHAMNNLENVHDKKGATYKRRWCHPVTGPTAFYSSTDKELLCWDVLHLAERLHAYGPCVLHSFDPVFWRQAAKTKTWTFRERMQQIIHLLAMSKARCEKLLAGMGLRMAVANPVALIASTRGNAKQNGRRQVFLEAGRAVERMKVEIKAEAEEDG